MIVLTHFGNGNRVALNVDLIEKIEETPDTVITLINGTRYLVQEPLDEIIEKTVELRARILHLSQTMPEQPDGYRLRLVRGMDGPAPEEGEEVRPR